MVIYVVGHKSPDSDSVCAAIAVAELKQSLGEKCSPRIAGKLNMETKFVLKKFGVRSPMILKNAKDKKIILVDHTELSQAVKGMDEVLEKKDEMMKEMMKLRKEKFAMFLMLTDILRGGSQLTCLSDSGDLDKKVFREGEYD